MKTLPYVAPPPKNPPREPEQTIIILFVLEQDAPFARAIINAGTETHKFDMKRTFRRTRRTACTFERTAGQRGRS